MMSSKYLSDGADLANAAIEILDRWHGFYGSGTQIFYVASEWADWELASSLEADTPQSQQLYEAALAAVGRWFGIRDLEGFRRYLANFKGRDEQ